MAARRAPLRAVNPDDRPTPIRKLTVTEAAAAGKDRELLAAMRERVATAVEDPNCPPRDLAALTRRLQELVRDIAAMDARGLEDDGIEVGDVAFDASAI
jgi:hypothetical protein